MTADTERASSETPTAQYRNLLELFGDERVCEILCHLESEPLTAPELIDRCEVSRPTVYRRLDRLTDAGVVDATERIGDDGRVRRVFSLTLGTVEFRISPSGIDGTVPGVAPAGD